MNEHWRIDKEHSLSKHMETKTPLTKSEIAIFALDDNDIALIRILKNKLVKMQLYDLAARLRDIEKEILLMIEYATIKRSEKRSADFKESLEFGDFLLRSFTACHWYVSVEGSEDKKIFGYVKNDDIESNKTYSTEDLYSLYLLDKTRINLSTASNQSTDEKPESPAGN